MTYMLEKYIRPDGGESLTLDDLRGDEELSKLYEQFFEEAPKKDKKAKKEKKAQNSEKSKKAPQPKVSIEDRASAGIDTSRCQCRIWPGEKYRLDNIQCSTKKSDGEYCKMHAKKIKEHGPWWLGDISDPRPEVAMGPSTAPKEKQKRHLWHDQVGTMSRPSKKKTTSKDAATPVEEPVQDAEQAQVTELTQASDPAPDTEPSSPSPSQASTHVPDSGNEDNEEQDEVSELSVDQNEYASSERGEEGEGDEDDIAGSDDDDLPDVIESSDDEDDTL